MAFGALCKVRCLSVYGLTTVGLWIEMEGNPKLLILSLQPRALLSNGPQVNCICVYMCDRGLDCFLHSGAGGEGGGVVASYNRSRWLSVEAR